MTVVVPTFNCGNVLERCLSSVKWATEIIVVDMGSTDETMKTAKKYNAKVYQRSPKDGNFDQNRKYGMLKASGNWILKLDSDEVLSPKLQNEILEFMKNDSGQYNGLNLHNRIFMLGKQIKHGFVKPDSHELRLVRNGHWHYYPFRFHQQITVDGKVSCLENYYDHYNVTSVSEFIKKMNRYTEIDAHYYTIQMSAGLVFLAPLKTFWKLFFWQLGFLDGQIGLEVCSLYSIYNLTEKAKVWEQQNS